jgi:hypothetical protein
VRPLLGPLSLARAPDHQPSPAYEGIPFIAFKSVLATHGFLHSTVWVIAENTALRQAGDGGIHLDGPCRGAVIFQALLNVVPSHSGRDLCYSERTPLISCTTQQPQQRRVYIFDWFHHFLL